RQIGRALLALEKHAEEAAPCVDVYVATIPPRFDLGPEVAAVIAQTNLYLRGLIARDRLIDLDPGITAADLQDDGIHLRWPAHARRADAAFRALFPTLAAP